MSTKTFCDGCSRPILHTDIHFQAQAQVKSAASGNPLHTTPTYDFCLKCKERFLKAMDIESWRSPHGL